MKTLKTIKNLVLFCLNKLAKKAQQTYSTKTGTFLKMIEFIWNKKIAFQSNLYMINISFVLLFTMFTAAEGNACNSRENNLAKFRINVISNEKTVDTINQTLKIKFWVIALDTTVLDSLRFTVKYSDVNPNAGFSFENVFISSNWSKIYTNLSMNKGDSILD